MRRGTLSGLLAYGLWGVFPLYFAALEPAGAIEVLVHRVLWSLVVCLLALAVLRGWSPLLALLRDRARLPWLVLASVTIAVNWGTYIYGVQSGNVVEASLGYFVNPLVTVGLGVLVLRERLRALQWTALAVGLVAVAVIGVGYGRVPWIALVLALSFGSYGLAKNRVGRGTPALTSLSGETIVLAPFALAVLLLLELRGDGTFTVAGPGHAAMLASTGVVTAVPLLLFAAAARRVPLSAIGLLQYLTPVMQLLCGVLLLGESVPPERWVGFALVWLALVALTTDSLRTARRRASLARAARASASG